MLAFFSALYIAACSLQRWGEIGEVKRWTGVCQVGITYLGECAGNDNEGGALEWGVGFVAIFYGGWGGVYIEGGECGDHVYMPW